MEYLTIEEYEELGGEMDENRFDLNLITAISYLDFYTSDRVEAATPSVKRALKEVVELLEENHQEGVTMAARAGIKAQTAGQTRVEFASGDIDQAKRQSVLESRIYSIFKRWLGNTGLMYRGI